MRWDMNLGSLPASADSSIRTYNSQIWLNYDLIVLRTMVSNHVSIIQTEGSERPWMIQVESGDDDKFKFLLNLY